MRKHVSGQLADDEQDDSEVHQLDSNFAYRQSKPINMRREKVEQQQSANEIAAGQQQRKMLAEEINAKDQPLSKISRLRIIQSLVHFRQRTDKNQEDGKSKQGNRKPEGDEQINQPAAD